MSIRKILVRLSATRTACNSEESQTKMNWRTIARDAEIWKVTETKVQPHWNKEVTFKRELLEIILDNLTRALTRAAMTKTRTVFRWVKRFLFVGRMETKKLERAILDKFETITEIVQRIPLKTIPGKLLLQTDMKERDASLPWPLVGVSLVLHT